MDTKPLMLHLTHHSVCTWIDVYKFIHQGTCGWSHLRDSTKLPHIKIRLHEELTSAGKPKNNEPLTELLDIKTNISRIHLRPWHSRGYSLDELWKKMLAVLATLEKSTTLLQQRWVELQTLWERGLLVSNPNQPEILHTWFRKGAALFEHAQTIEEIPHVSHSQLYHSKYQPSYRLGLLKKE